MHVHPQGGEKNFAAKFTEKVVSASPGEQESIFDEIGGDLDGGSG